MYIMIARIMRKHTAKRRALARRPFPIRITSPQREVADRLYTTAPIPIIAQRAELCQFLPVLPALRAPPCHPRRPFGRRFSSPPEDIIPGRSSRAVLRQRFRAAEQGVAEDRDGPGPVGRLYLPG